jgi:hypothetical protein
MSMVAVFARIEHQLWPNAIRLPCDGSGQLSPPNGPARQVERLGVGIGVNGNFRRPPAHGDLESVGQERSADCAIHELREHPKIVELPG